jgi:signal transduction histidine kinase
LTIVAGELLRVVRSLLASRQAQERADFPTKEQGQPIWPRPPKLLRQLLVLTAYGVAFTLLRSASSRWATHKLFSVWFPAAGLRFAFLWIAGPRWVPAAALAELVISVGAGTVQLSSDWALSLLGVVGPCLVYGAVIRLVQARSRRSSVGGEFDPLAFGMAAILGPMTAWIAALPWALPLSWQRGTVDAPVLFSALLVFTLGDLLGILIIAPPLLWFAYRARSGEWSTIGRARRAARIAELAGLLACAWALVWLLQRLGDGLVLAPVLLAACWCGLRGGRVIAWAAILATALIVLPMTGNGVSDAERVQVHMQLACIAVGAYLAGSYADAQARAIREISRRDRLLLHAERLKTLRAMSVAVIHEVSQPLSTIAIEARALVETTQAPDPSPADIQETAALIARKADHLAELIRRLRAFGSGGNERRAVQSVSQLVADVVGLAAAEARSAKVAIVCAEGPELKASVHDVEIRQAVLNLLRNAIAAAPKPGGVVTIGWSQARGFAQFWIENAVDSKRPAYRGMGLGLIISRTIAQAHGGRVTIEQTSAGGVRSTLHVPLTRGVEE